MDTMKIAGLEYRVLEYIDAEPFRRMPVVDVPMMSDYRWQLKCLNDRLDHPEKYAGREDVEQVVAGLREWLDKHEADRREIA